MNIALLVQQQLVAAVGRLRYSSASPGHHAPGPTILHQDSRQDAIPFVANVAVSTSASMTENMRPLVKPLRVVRLLEAGQARASVGRMVISGRMADVCAELDRLAATEAVIG
jgi:hypothetical protein